MVSQNLEDLQLVGGRPCLDFINTEGDVRNGPPERIDSYVDLLAWSVLAGVLDAEEAERLAESGSPAVVERAVELREALYRIFSATIAKEPVLPADRQVLDAELAISLSHKRLIPTDGSWRWEFVGEGVDSMLWRLADDACELLTSPDLDRVRECSGDTCSWLFLDKSRNRSRRWCDMADCGNRAKARRFYSKKRKNS